MHKLRKISSSYRLPEIELWSETANSPVWLRVMLKGLSTITLGKPFVQGSLAPRFVLM